MSVPAAADAACGGDLGDAGEVLGGQREVGRGDVLRDAAEVA